jgi:hypothetical protein
MAVGYNTSGRVFLAMCFTLAKSKKKKKKQKKKRKRMTSVQNEGVNRRTPLV